MRQLVTSRSLVLSRIDYCNIVVAGLPASTIAPFHVQNAAARLVLRLDCRSHISAAALHELNWLPMKYRIQFKTAVFMHQKVTAQRCPSYVADLVAFCSSDSQQRPLRSTSTRAAINSSLISDDVRSPFAVRKSGTVSHRRYAPRHRILHFVQSAELDSLL